MYCAYAYFSKDIQTNYGKILCLHFLKLRKFTEVQISVSKFWFRWTGSRSGRCSWRPPTSSSRPNTGQTYGIPTEHNTLIKKKRKFSSYIRKFRMEQLQSHLTNGVLIYGEYLRISSYIRKPFFTYDFATASLWISLYMRKIWFSFLSVYTVPSPLYVADQDTLNHDYDKRLITYTPDSVFKLGLSESGSGSWLSNKFRSYI